MQIFLYDLIAGLSPAEKRFFTDFHEKVQSPTASADSASADAPRRGRPTGADTPMLLLYREIESLCKKKTKTGAGQKFSAADLDDEVLKRHLKQQGREMTARQFTDAKSNLYRELLKSLRRQQEGQSEEAFIKATLQEARLLERRGLPDAALQKLEQAHRSAQKYQLHHLAVEALKGIVKIQIAKGGKDYLETMDGFFEQLETAAALAHEEAIWYSRRNQASMLFRTRDLDQTEWGKAKTRQLEQAAEQGEPAHFRTREHWNSTKVALSPPSERLQFFKKIADEWENKDSAHFKTEHPSEYLTALNNVLNSCNRHGDEQGFQKYLRRLENFDLKPDDHDLRAEHFQTFRFVEQQHFLDRAELTAAHLLAPKIKKGLAEHAGKISRAREMSFYFNMMLAAFGTANYSEAYENIEHLLKNPASVRPDLAKLARYFKIMVLYEMDDRSPKQQTELDNFEKSTRQNLEQVPESPDFERLMLQNLLDVLKAVNGNPNDPRAAQSAFRKFQNDLETFQAANPKTEGLDAILLWVDSNLGGESFQHLMKEKLKEKLGQKKR